LFDTLTGLPGHILAAHFAAVLIPLSAIATIAVALRKPWREKYAGPLAVGNVAMLALTFFTIRAGEHLEGRYRMLGDARTPKFNHEALGRTLLWIMVALAVGSLANWAIEPMRAAAPAAGLVAAGVIALLASVSLVFAVLAGHTGSESHWKEFIQSSDQQNSHG
jgi:fatty acid desaturase